MSKVDSESFTEGFTPDGNYTMYTMRDKWGTVRVTEWDDGTATQSEWPSAAGRKYKAKHGVASPQDRRIDATLVEAGVE